MIQGYEDNDLIIGCIHAFRRKCCREGQKVTETDLLPLLLTSRVRQNDGLVNTAVVFLRNDKHTVAVYGVKHYNGKLKFRKLYDSEY